MKLCDLFVDFVARGQGDVAEAMDVVRESIDQTKANPPSNLGEW